MSLQQFPRVPEPALGLPQLPTRHRPERPVLLVIDQELAEDGQ
jgi:hypothetical protein